MKRATSKKKHRKAAPKREVKTRARLYADAAAATPVHPRVLKRLAECMSSFANPGSLHKEGVAAKKALEEAHATLAESIGAHPDEIILTGSGTEANNLALLGALYPLLRQHGDAHVITLAVEHPSVLEPLYHLKKYGLELTVLPVNEEGLVAPRDIAEAIRPETALVSVQLVNSEIGTIEPLREIGKFIRYARKLRAEAQNPLPLLFHTDAAQAPLYLPLNVEKLGVDLMTLDAQKVEGPKGVGLLYRRRDTILEPIMFGGRQESGLRPGTENVMLAAAFAEALHFAQQRAEKYAEKVARVRDVLVKEILARLPDTVVNGSRKDRIANNLNVSIPGLDGERAVIALDALGIAISTRSACETKEEGPSHVITAIGATPARAREAIRITLLPEASATDARIIAESLARARALYGTIKTAVEQ